MGSKEEMFWSNFNGTKLYGIILDIWKIPSELQPELKKLIASEYEPAFRKIVEFTKNNGEAYPQKS